MSSPADSSAFAGWQIVFLIGAAIGFVIAASSSPRQPIGRQRTRYWTGWVSTAVCMAFVVVDRGIGAMAFAAFFVLLIAARDAYESGPSIRIGNRVFSLFPETVDGKPITDRPGYYRGGMSPRKYWWLLTMMLSLVAWAITDRGWGLVTIAGTAVMSLFTFGTGLLDARDGQAPARRQYLPAFVALIASIFSFGAPALGYLLGYTLGRRHTVSDGPPPDRPVATPAPRRSPDPRPPSG